MPILPQFRAIGTHDLTKGLHSAPQNRNSTTVSRDRHAESYTKGLHSAPQNRNFTTVLCDRHARSYERVALSTAKSQFYYSFVRSTRTISRKGSSSTNEIAILLQFRAIDTHDLTKGFIQHKRNRNLTTVSCNRHARSHERVHPAQTKNRNLTTVSCDRHARSYERVAFPQAFSGPWRPPPSLLN